MRVGLIGQGAIGRYVSEQMRARGLAPHAILVRSDASLDAEGPPRVTHAAALPADTDLMVDCAGHAALAEHGPAILARGIDLISVSAGALADPVLIDRLEAAALAGGARLHLASGAIGALDCLQAARVGGLDKVIYIGRKPPQGWKGSPAEERLDLEHLDAPTVHFEGSARQASREYPKNANVAAAVAIAGIGFDKTQVRLIADPTETANVHEVRAEGSFGAFTFRIEGRPLPDNPRSSALAAMSVIAAIERQRNLLTV